MKEHQLPVLITVYPIYFSVHSSLAGITLTGYVNPLQMHTFDYISRNIVKVDTMDTVSFQKVVQLNHYIFNE